MKNEQRIGETERDLAEMRQATDILYLGAPKAGKEGLRRLRNAHLHLHAAVLADFFRRAERDDWIGPAVDLKQGGIKPTRDFLIDHLFDVLFAPVRKLPNGDDFILEIKFRTKKILEVFPVPQLNPDRKEP